MKTLGSLLSLLFFCAPLLAQTAPPSQLPMHKDQALGLARKYVADFLAGNAHVLWQQMTPRMQQALKDEDHWSSYNQTVLQQMGKETAVISEKVLPSLQYQSYTRLSTISAAAIKMVMSMAIDPEGKIAGFFVQKAPNPAESNYLDYKTKTPLRLPFRGEWTVYQGGRSVVDNYHAAFPDQRFAYDLVVFRDDRQFSSDPGKLDDFYPYGQAILAPGDGKVVEAVDQYDDNPISKPSKDAPKQGNNIVIDHGNGEFSMLAHLKRGSIKVKPGDTVKAGQEIAACGNSGNSPIPHLHYHLQTTPEWFRGDGLPIQFLRYISNGKPVDRGEPVRGEAILNQ